MTIHVLSEVVGLTFVKVETGCCDEDGDEAIVFHSHDGRRFHMYHGQDCCESVYVEDIVGDLEDLLGSPIVRAEERTEGGYLGEDRDDGIRMWTFYEFATVKGSVTIRWCGSSNGYYSVSVSFHEVTDREEDDD